MDETSARMIVAQIDLLILRRQLHAFALPETQAERKAAVNETLMDLQQLLMERLP